MIRLSFFTVLFLAALYAASYFASVQTYGLAGNGSAWCCHPGYGFGIGPWDRRATWFYAPIHKLDRRALRPGKWSGVGTQYPPEWQFMNSVPLHKRANNPALDGDARCLAVFSLFRQFVKPGEMPEALFLDTRWLERTNIHGIYAVGGWVPVNYDLATETAFVISVLPTVKPDTGHPPELGYHIYLTLSGGALRSEESAFAILTGHYQPGEKARILRFALCYPDGTIEHVSKRGISGSKPFASQMTITSFALSR